MTWLLMIMTNNFIVFKHIKYLPLLALVSACGGGGGNNQPQPPPVVIDTIPIAVDDFYSTDQDVPLAADVSSNDTGLDDAPVTYLVSTAPTDGSVELSSSGNFIFTPAAGFVGTAIFTYTVTDNDGDTDGGNVSITVNELVADNQPVAVNDSYSIDQGQSLSANVASNDSGLVDTPITFTHLTTPASGELNFNDDGSFSYTPDSGFSGSVTFQYQVTDVDGDSDTAMVDIRVTETTAGVQWQSLDSEVTLDVESQVTQLVAQMTTSEKVGQLIMAEIQSVTPTDVRT